MPRASWIIQSQKRQSDRPPAPAAREFVSGETFLYLGRQYRLRLELDHEPLPLRLDHGWLVVALPTHLPEQHQPAYVRAALTDWYRRNASKKVPERINHWAGKLDVKAPEVLLTEPRRRWGSASVSGTVRINWRIVQAPLSLVDYVVLHELAHLRHPNHTRHFWAAIGQVMPDYDQRKARLRGLGPQLEW